MIDFETAKSSVDKVISRRVQFEAKIDILKRYLVARCQKELTQFREVMMKDGMHWLAKQRARYHFRGSEFVSFLDKVFAHSEAYIEANIKQRKFCSLESMNAYARRAVHVTQKGKGRDTYSTGPTYDRTIHIIDREFWDDVFPTHLPYDIIGLISPKTLDDEQEPLPKRKKKIYYCCECNDTLERCECDPGLCTSNFDP